MIERSVSIWLQEFQVPELNLICRSREISRAAACEKNGSMEVSFIDLNIYSRYLCSALQEALKTNIIKYIGC